MNTYTDEDLAVARRVVQVMDLAGREDLARRLRLTREQVDEKIALDVARERAAARRTKEPLDDLGLMALARGQTREALRQHLERHGRGRVA